MGDNIKKPDHYCEGRKYEPKDVIRDWGLNFNLGSAVKYISRAGRKGDKLEDLQKAKQFLQFEIEALAEGEDLKCIVRKIDNDELDCFDIPSDLYHAYQDIRDPIGRQALRHVGKEQKSDIGTTCREAAEIGDAIAKGFEESFTLSFKEELEQEDVLPLADTISMIMKHNDIPEPDVIKLHFKFEDDPTAIPANTVSIKFHTTRKEI